MSFPGLRNLFGAIRRAPKPPTGDGRLRTRGGDAIDLELFTKDDCPYCQRVYRALARLDVRPRMRDIRRDDGALADLVRIGGKKQVPCMMIDGKPLYESDDIVRILDEKFGARDD